MADAEAPLPKATISYYRRHREAPTLVVHLTETAGKSAADLNRRVWWRKYPPVLVAPWYAIQRKPASDSVSDVLHRLPRL